MSNISLEKLADSIIPVITHVKKDGEGNTEFSKEKAQYIIEEKLLNLSQNLEKDLRNDGGLSDEQKK